MIDFKKVTIIFAAAVYGLFISASPTFAIVVKSGDTITINKDEIINESLYVGGQSINVDGTVNGDIFCGGKDVEISGVVNGDVICGAQSITISGQIKGNVRVAGQSIRLNGSVERNANFLGQNIDLSSGSAILGETFIGSQNADIDGLLAKKLSGGSQSMRINGSVADTDIHVESLTVGSTAIIEKNLNYTSDTNAKIARKESIGGSTVRHTPPPRTRRADKREGKALSAIWSGARIASLLSQILLALLIVYFLPKRVYDASLRMQEKVLPAFGWGALMLLLFPIAMILFVVTIVGIPLAMALLLVFIFAFFLSRVLAAFVVGRLLLQQFWAAKKDNNYWIVAIGFIVLWLIYSAPYIGGLIGFLSFIWGFGGVYYMLRPGTATPKPVVKKSAKK